MNYFTMIFIESKKGLVFICDLDCSRIVVAVLLSLVTVLFCSPQGKLKSYNMVTSC